MHTGVPRPIGATASPTAVYRPGRTARPCGLVDPHGGVGPPTAVVVPPVTRRDAVGGPASALAPPDGAPATASAVRIASAPGGALLPGRTRRVSR